MFKEDKPESNTTPKQQEKKEGKKITFSDGLDITVVTIVGFLFIAIIFTFLSEFVFDANIDWKGLGIDTGIVAACTIAIYLLLRAVALRRGRKTQRWKDASERLNEKGKEIIDKNYVQYISAYCREWERKHLEDERSIVLEPVDISLSDFKKNYCALSDEELINKYPDLTKRQRKALKKVRNMKIVRYDESYLYVSRRKQIRRSSPSGGLSTKTINILDNLRTVATTLLTSLFSASILQEVIFNPTKETVIKLIVKLAIIVTFAALGIVAGYNFAVSKEKNEMDAKSDEMDAFMKWCADGKYEERKETQREDDGICNAKVAPADKSTGMPKTE